MIDRKTFIDLYDNKRLVSVLRQKVFYILRQKRIGSEW